MFLEQQEVQVLLQDLLAVVGQVLLEAHQLVVQAQAESEDKFIHFF